MSTTTTEAPEVEAPTTVENDEAPEAPEATAVEPVKKAPAKKAPKKAPAKEAPTLTAERDDLLAAVTTAARASTGSSMLPGYGLLHVVASQTKATARGFDGEVQITTSFRVEERRKVEAYLPAGLFAGIVRACPAGPVVMKLEDGQAKITAGDYEATIELSGDDTPEAARPTGEVVKVPAFEFAAAMRRALVSVSGDAARPLLCAVQIRPDGTVASTDSYRLTVQHPGLPSLGDEALVETRALQAMLSLVSADDDELEVVRDENLVSVRSAKGEVVGRLVQGEYPKWDGLIPAKAEFAISAPREALAAAVRRVQPIVKEAGPTSPVKLTVKADSMLVTSMGAGVGATEQPIAVESSGAVTICFNPSYLLDALEMFDDDTVQLDVIDATKPAVVHAGHPEAVLALVMPVRSA